MITVVIHNQSRFNHGCQDWATVEVDDAGNGIVTEVHNCTSCWQVGHDANHVFAEVGDKVKVGTVDEYGESENWEFAPPTTAQTVTQLGSRELWSMLDKLAVRASR